ncbi:MAG: four-carbon acid sugar kinase family protein [Rubrobacteraceae bacterium]
MLSKIRDEIDESGRYLVALDDDPTGTQSVSGVPVLTTWSPEDLRWALTQPVSTFFILTNSRSLPEEEAVALNRLIAVRLVEAAAEVGTDFVVASRSDSTLRGHYPAEVEALREALESSSGRKIDGVVLCPCFLEAGRLTVDDVHWVKEDERLMPAGQTEFASDANFGYSSSNLAEWVEEKTAGRIAASEVLRISLSDIREGGPERVGALLRKANDGRSVVVNATEYADLEVFALGLLQAEASGKSFLYRVGPSFVRARGGIVGADPVSVENLYARGDRGRGQGLVLVGSHVEMTTRQLEQAVSLGGLQEVELSVRDVIYPDSREKELARVEEVMNQALLKTDVIVYTSREVVSESTDKTGFEIGRLVSESLVELVRRLDRTIPLRFVVAKGGITASDIGVHGMGVRRAEVAGTLLPGIIPVWILPKDSEFPGLPYIIFPGNVGGSETLAEVIEILRNGGKGGEAGR